MKNKPDLEKILPHNHPMILIDELLYADLEKAEAKASVTINENKIFYDKTVEGADYLTGIEFMAQTVGCYAFYKNNRTKPEVGFLLGTRQFKNNIERFEKGKTYIIKAKEIFTDNELVSFECFIYNDTVECQRAVINVYQPETGSLDIAGMYG